MTKLNVAQSEWTISKNVVARLLLSLGAVGALDCSLSAAGDDASVGASFGDARAPMEGGRRLDASHGVDGGNAPTGGDASDGASNADVTRPSDSGKPMGGDGRADGAQAPDGHVAADSAIIPDGAKPHDGALVSPFAVDLGTAASFVVLTETGISTGATTAITGNLGVSPAAAAAITGFSLVLDSSGTFSTSSLVTGDVFGANYAAPTPANLGMAIGDMEQATVDAAGRTPDVTELGAGNIGGLTLTPGVYAWSTGLLIPDDVTLAGGPTDVWIFQLAQTLTMSASKNIVLTGGATAEHVFWSVAGAVALGTSAHLEGIVLADTSVALGTSASIKGRLLAQTAVTMADGVIVGP